MGVRSGLGRRCRRPRGLGSCRWSADRDCGSPGNYWEPITVGATDDLDQRASPLCYSPDSGSNFGSRTDVVAPGNLILGAALGGGYESWCGTSQAAPLVSGLVGIMESINTSPGREEARHLLRSGAEDLVGRPSEDTTGFD